MENSINYLKSKSIRPSVIRTNVYKYLADRDEHHTVDEIYKALLSIIPTLSKVSVYNALELFIENGIVKLVRFDSNTAYYELVKEKHLHFVCVTCGTVYDIPDTVIDFNKDQLNQFSVEHVEVLLKGTCESCKNKHI